MKCRFKNESNSLKSAKINEVYKIKSLSVELNARYARRLCELGFYPGAEVRIVRYSPIGKTMLVSVGNTVVLMRKDLAAKIILEV